MHSPTFLRAPSARTLSIPTRKPRRVELRKPRRVPILLADGRVACCLTCARLADARRTELKPLRPRVAAPSPWLTAVGRLVLLAIYATYVSAVLSPPLDVPAEIPAQEYELSDWP
jgi:hypothetical protein